MKRNKPLFKQKRPGKHYRMRRKSPTYYGDYDRCSETWKILVPQSTAGTDARTFDMTGAVPAGETGKPDDPTLFPGLYRWRLDRAGKSVFVYTQWGNWYPWTRHDGPPRGVPSGDVWYVFTAQGKCTRPRCPMTRYSYADSDAEVAHHRPGQCPLGIPLDGSWKFAGRLG